MGIRALAIYLAAVVLLLASYYTSSEHIGRYLKYLIFPLFVFFLLFYKIIVVKKFLVYNLVLYTGLIALNFVVTMYNGVFHPRFLEESFLLIIPILTVAAITGGKETNIKNAIDVFFVAYVLSFLLFFWRELINVPKLIKGFVTAIRLSEFPTESWLAFPLGLFTIYYFLEKRRWFFLISLCFFLLSFKRIALVGFIVVLGFWFLNEKVLKKSFQPKQFAKLLLGVNIIFVASVYLFVSGFFSIFVKRYFNMSINHLTQGRFVVYNDVLNQFSQDLWTGSSLGSIHLYLRKKYETFEYIHSDILKIVIELWLFSFII